MKREKDFLRLAGEGWIERMLIGEFEAAFADGVSAGRAAERAEPSRRPR